jgi:hypothetical protein
MHPASSIQPLLVTENSVTHVLHCRNEDGHKSVKIYNIRFRVLFSYLLD